MHLPSEGAEQALVETLVGDHDGQRRAPRRRSHREPGGQALLHGGNERTPMSGSRVEMAAHDVAAAVDDRADGVDDGEDRDLRLADPAERGALARRLAFCVLERLAHRRGAPGSALSEREAARPRGLQRRAPECLVRVDGVVAPTPVEDDRAGHERDVEPTRAVAAAREELGRDAGRRLEPVERAAGEADRVHPFVARARRPGRAAADVDGAGGPVRKVEDRAPRRALVVLGDADLQTSQVELERGAGELGARAELQRVVRGTGQRRRA